MEWPRVPTGGHRLRQVETSYAGFGLRVTKCTQAAEELTDEPLLKYYTDEWSRYTQGASFVTRLFAYLNRR